MVSDTVVAIVPENVLPALLSQIHRAGLGQTARVLRPHRHPVQDQLERAGVSTRNMPHRVNDADAVLMVMAAARSPIAANLALQSGASAIWIISRSGAWTFVDDHAVVEPAPKTVATPQAPLAPPPDADLPAGIPD